MSDWRPVRADWAGPCGPVRRSLTVALLDRRQGQGLLTKAVSIVNRVPPFGVGQHQRLGDALTAAQKAYAQTGMMPELVGVYHRLGDPAMKIR